YGPPNPNPGGGESVTQIAMSRDGAEGWAIGARTTLYHFDGTRWRRCSPNSLEGVLVADRACKELLSLSQGGAELTAIARIPMEYGSDPTQADNFEAIAATRYGQILRYRDGSWTVEPGVNIPGVTD